ncbi:GNAT family N-acetyltransferase [Pseudoflavonifractor sp.]|jgi:ribosomal-protein-alanine N-acetyltransferase|uniref:GNAT family N-acetyltransferase n=1 Tax=Pseudoflavonifractor sp. TaxID=1980281 RepID=UPI003D8F5FD8
MIFSDTVTTPRLLLRCLAPEDAACIFQIRRDTSYAALMGWTPYQSMAEAEDYIRRVRSTADCRSWAAVLEGKTVGAFCLWRIDRAAAVAELGYELLPHVRRLGLAKEACTALLPYEMEVIPLSRVDAFPRADNLPSVRLLSSLGFCCSESPFRSDSSLHFSYYSPGGTRG